VPLAPAPPVADGEDCPFALELLSVEPADEHAEANMIRPAASASPVRLLVNRMTALSVR